MSKFSVSSCQLRAYIERTRIAVEKRTCSLSLASTTYDKHQSSHNPAKSFSCKLFARNKIKSKRKSRNRFKTTKDSRGTEPKGLGDQNVTILDAKFQREAEGRELLQFICENFLSSALLFGKIKKGFDNKKRNKRRDKHTESLRKRNGKVCLEGLCRRKKCYSTWEHC